MVQVKRSKQTCWLADIPRARPDLESVPFVGKVAGLPSAPPKLAAEIRRRDVGEQQYGGGVPKQTSVINAFGLTKKPSAVSYLETSIGAVQLSKRARELKFLPTTTAIDFLRHEYLGSRQPVPRQRFFPV